MSKRPYTSHRAILSIQFDCWDTDPDEAADALVRDMIGDGYPVVLDDVEDVSPSGHDLDEYSYFCFVRDALECGHGQKFKATFCCRREGDMFCIESVDVSAALDGTPEYGIGGVGGELLLECPRNSDGSFNFEQMCRDWLGVWHRQFVGTTEESIFGLYLIIRQIVAEGQWIK
jgi:hypothetical protein